MKTTTADGRIRRIKIQREAEGYLELGLPQHSLRTLDRLGDPADFDVDALYLWGEGLQALERPYDALVPLERAARLAPRDVRVRIALGWCYKRTGRLDLAIRGLEQILPYALDEAIVYYNLACYYSLAGKRRQSLRYLIRALNLDEVYRELVETEPDFDPIRNDPQFKAICAKA
jgi:Flp pilus assembly protein TadD